MSVEDGQKVLADSVSIGKTVEDIILERRLIEEVSFAKVKAEIMGVTVIDEKALGTAHIAVGSNAWFGGTIYSKIHLDQVFRDAKVYIDDEYIDIRKL